MSVPKKEKYLKLLINHSVWLLWSILYAFSFPTYNISVAIWFAFVPVIIFAYEKAYNETLKYAFFYSFIFFFLAFFWLYGFWAPSLFLIIPVYSIYYAFFFFCIAFIGKNLKSYRWILTPLIWISNELLRSTGFHGFPWNLLGDSQWNIPFLVQSADIFGVWGISFLIILVNSVIAEFFDTLIKSKSIKNAIEKNYFKSIFTISLFLINLLYGVFQYYNYKAISKKSPKEKLALLQPNIGSHEPWWSRRWENYGILWKLNAEAAIQKPDIIIWSETMVKNYIWFYLSNWRPDEEVNLFNIRFVKMPYEFNTPILLTSPSFVDNRNYNSADYIDPAVKEIQSNSKIHLVPFGEWMPGYDSLPIVKDIMNIEGAGAYWPSTNFNVIQGRKSRFRVLVCYEDIFAILARKFIKKRVNYFVNVTNDGWAYRLGFRHPMWQHLAGATLTAISVRRPIARAANTGVSGIIEPNGKFSGNIGDYRRGFYIGEVPIVNDEIETIYVRFGYVFPYLVLLVTFTIFIFTFIKTRKINSALAK